jgi:TP901 family phage tail tape measure protein
MAKDVEIKIKLTEIGGEEIKKLVAEITNVDEVTKALSSSVKETGSAFEKTAQIGFQFAQIKELIESVAEAFNSLTKPALEFEYSMRKVNTIANMGETEFKKLKSSVADLASELPIARDLLADGMYQTISSDVPEDNWIDFLRQSTKASIGGFADLEKVILGTANVVKTYGLEWKEVAGIQDKIQQVTKYGQTSFEEMADGLQKVTSTAATLGVSIDELMATYATLTGISGNTAEVSTQLSGVLKALIAPTTAAEKAARDMGIQFGAGAVKAAGGFIPFLKKLTEEISRYAKAQDLLDVEVESMLFPSAVSLKALIPLTGELSEKFEENFKIMADSAGVIDFAFEQMNSTSQAATQRMKNTLAGLTDFISGVAGAITPFMQFVAVTGIATAQMVALGKALKAINWAGFGQMLKRAATAVRAFAVSAAGSWALATAGVSVLIFAMMSLFKKTDDATEKAKKLKEEEEQFNKSVAESAGEMIAKYEKLRQEYNALGKSISEKTKFLKTHRTELEELGIEIDNVKDAETIFTGQTDAVIKAFKARALAAAYAAKASAVYEKHIDLDNKREAALAGVDTMMKKGSITGTVVSEKGYDHTYAPDTPLSESEKEAKRQEINEYYDKLANDIDMEAQQLVSKSIENNGIFDAIIKNLTGEGHTPKEPKGLLRDLEDEITRVNKLLKDAPTRKQAVQYQKELDVLNKLKKTLEDEIKLEAGFNKPLKGKYENVFLDDAVVKDLRKKGSEWIAALGKQKLVIPISAELKIEQKDLNLDFVKENIKKYQGQMFGGAEWNGEEVKLLQKNIGIFDNVFKDIGSNDFSFIKEQLDYYNQLLKSGREWGEETEVYIRSQRDRYKELYGTLQEAPSEFEKIQQAAGAVSSAFDNIGKAIDGAAGSMLQWGAQMLSTIAQTIPQILMLTGAISAETAVNWGLAASEAAAENAKNGPFGWIMAIAAVAGIIALMQSVPKYADGGIAYGPTLGLFGEYSGASNNPEVVAPLSKLKDLIEPAGGYGEVRFEIEGRTLVGVLNKINLFNDRTR